MEEILQINPEPTNNDIEPNQQPSSGGAGDFESAQATSPRDSHLPDGDISGVSSSLL